MLHENGIRYRLHVKDIPGNPDLCNKKKGFVIFVNGCFWHRHEGCKDFVVPKTRTEWWIEKINKNVIRDKNNFNELNKLGFNIFIVWECELVSNKIDSTLNELYKKIKCLN
tara:strand:+ start:220 stop:552 length:333 start_codon:yes stop_codon:yes gene_type:complete